MVKVWLLVCERPFTTEACALHGGKEARAHFLAVEKDIMSRPRFSLCKGTLDMELRPLFIG